MAGVTTMRILLYSPDSYGLGHVRRSISIAGAVLGRMRGSTALLLTGAPRAHYFDYPEGCDYVKLPSMTKNDAGLYVSRELDLPGERTVQLREGLIRLSAREFAPDVVVVDHAPLGLAGEILPTLRRVKRDNPRAVRVLGMRDVIDDPATVRAAWKRDGVIDVLRECYDLIVVYGQREIFDPVSEYGIPDDIAAKVSFVGYIDRTPPAIDADAVRAVYAARTGKLIVVTLGGGGDGNLMLRAFLEGFRSLGERPPFEVVAVTGPLMSPGKRERFRGLAETIPQVTLLDYTAEMPRLIAAADFVVSMGGYNTICELAGAGARALIVPRTFPRQEQLIRARMLAERKVVEYLAPDELNPASLMKSVSTGVESPKPPVGWGLRFDGLSLTAQMLEQRLCPAAARPEPAICPIDGATGRGSLSALLLMLLMLMFPLGARADEARFGPGTWVTVKGSFEEDVFHAAEVERLDERGASIKGAIDGFLPDAGEIRFGALVVKLDEQSRLQRDDGTDLARADLSDGQRVKISLDAKRWQRVKRLRLLEGNEGRLRLEGRIESVRSSDKEMRFRMLGVEVLADPGTAWEGIVQPRLTGIDDEDLRPTEGIQLGSLGRLSGEFRLDYKGEDNFDLTDQVQSDLDEGRARTRVELTFPATRRVSGMFQVKAQEERELRDQADDSTPNNELTLGQSYVLLSGILGRHGSLQIGRSRFDDHRDWLFNRDVDALRMRFDFARFQLEASIAEEVIDPVERHEDIRNLLLEATAFPGTRHIVSAYRLDRDDGFSSDGSQRDFSPELTGVRVAGEDRYWSWWLDAALARGSVDGERLEGEAFDIGTTLIAPWRGEPSLTLGYAMGSGDDDPFDGVNHTFRQSGLQLNNGKWNGVSSFRYYGELMRPELANLHVQTIGLGLRPKSETSIDVVYHRYDLDEPAPELIDAAFDDRTLNLVDRFVGEEWDLVVGFEELAHFEFELDLAYFKPGEVFLGPTDPATSARLKVKYVF